MSSLHFRSFDAFGYFFSRRIVETAVERYAKARRKTAALINDDNVPRMLAIKAVEQIRIQAHVWGAKASV